MEIFAHLHPEGLIDRFLLCMLCTAGRDIWGPDADELKPERWEDWVGIICL